LGGRLTLAAVEHPGSDIERPLHPRRCL